MNIQSYQVTVCICYAAVASNKYIHFIFYPAFMVVIAEYSLVTYVLKMGWMGLQCQWLPDAVYFHMFHIISI